MTFFAAGSRSSRPKRKLTVAVLANLISVDGFRMNVELLGDTIAQASRVKHGAAADNFSAGKPEYW